MAGMKLIAAAALTVALGAPLLAQQWQMPRADEGTGSEPPQAEDPFTLPDRNSEGLEGELEGIMGDMFQRLQPHLEGLANELASTADEFRPALNEFSGLMDDIGNYERPERLPNGDILIRRRADAPPPPPLEELQNLLPKQQPPAPSAPNAPLTPTAPETEL
ncbi:hypothetical protein [Paracoccus xiamenensis]|uniref:hypothetical protein n=1 Tax=Paracoccus xiamenensis TaxID=2714901 RepID=UPI001A991496|nr:hypothetical protein [Paracoccus xiamenensis]